MSLPFLGHFNLVGGTSLALQLGHRKSIDLDLFSIIDFDQTELLEYLQVKYDVEIESKSPSILITQIEEIKVDFVKFRYPIAFPVLEVESVRMLDLRDIAPMKLDAVAKRGSKKDFYDIFFLLEKMPLKEMLNLYSAKYQHATIFHIVKSLTYFEDAEENPDPEVFDKSNSWKKVKMEINKAVRLLHR